MIFALITSLFAFGFMSMGVSATLSIVLHSMGIGLLGFIFSLVIYYAWASHKEKNKKTIH